MVDPENRTRPLTFHERHQNILKAEKNILQSELDIFDQWTLKKKFIVNSKKCFVTQFSRSRNYGFPIEFKISGSGHLEEKRVVRILGIQVQSNLRRDCEITQMTSKASKTIWTLRRMKILGHLHKKGY